MSKVSTPRKLGIATRIIGNMAGRRAGSNRFVRAGYSAFRATVGHVGHVLHTLFLELTGFLFLSIALIGGAAAVREYHKWQAGTTGAGRFALAVTFTVLFAYFGVTSFWRTRKR